MFGVEKEYSFAVGYFGRLCLHEQHRHNLCRSPAGIIHAHLISSLPSMLWCPISLQHFSLPCVSECNIFCLLKCCDLGMDNAVRLFDKKFITIHAKEGRGTWAGRYPGGDQPHGQDGRPSPWGQGKACRYLWDSEWLGKEQMWENRGMRGQKRLVWVCRGWLSCLSGYALCLISAICPFFSLNSISDHFPGWGALYLCAQGCENCRVTAARVGPELTRAVCLWATAGVCEGVCVSVRHQRASGWTGWSRSSRLGGCQVKVCMRQQAIRGTRRPLPLTGETIGAGGGHLRHPFVYE